MHTLHFDPSVERQLDQLASRTGKKVDQLIEQVVLDFLTSRADSNNPPGLGTDRNQAQDWCDSLRRWVESQPMQTESAGTFTRRMRDGERY